MRLRFIVIVAIASAGFITCRHEIPLPNTGSGNPTSNPTCSSDSVYFANSILPLITSACAMSGCHDAITREEDLVLNSYSGIMKIVQPGNASGSKLYKVIILTDPGDIMPPPPLSPLSAANKAAIQKWIIQGAKNNQCIAECDTTVFTYSASVTPIMNTWCKGCHNPASLGGGIDLSTYNSVKLAATSGRLLGSIKHLPGYIAMPQGSSILSNCQIRQIEKWVQSGTPNN